MNMLQQKDGIKYGNLSHDAGNDTAAKYCTPEEKEGGVTASGQVYEPIRSLC